MEPEHSRIADAARQQRPDPDAERRLAALFAAIRLRRARDKQREEETGDADPT